jgi:hypothetical protein
VPPQLEQAILRALARTPDDRFRSAEDLRTALLGTRLDAPADQTVATDAATLAAVGAMAGTTPSPGAGGGPTTPGWGTPAVPGPAASPRRVGSGVIVSLAVVLALVLVALLVATTDLGERLFEQGPPSTEAPEVTTQAATATGARSFDPEGTGGQGENDRLAAAVLDGQPSTSWRTETYTSRSFGNLKSGVGLVVDLDSPTSLETLTIASPTTGWAATVHVGDGSATTLAAWGPPVAQADAIAGQATLDLGGTDGRSVLVWITDLGDGPSNRVEITEITIGS